MVKNFSLILINSTSLGGRRSENRGEFTSPVQGRESFGTKTRARSLRDRAHDK